MSHTGSDQPQSGAAGVPDPATRLTSDVPDSAAKPAPGTLDSATNPASGQRAGRSPVQISLGSAVIAIFLIFPVVITDPTATTIAFYALAFMVAASAWNVFSGYTGYLALGHAVFFGTGGYALALLCQGLHVGGGWPSFALLPLCGIIAALIAIPVGLVCLRTRRHTFVVVTIAIFFIFQLAATNVGFTGGTSGLFEPLPPFSGANYNTPFYYVALVILALTVLVSWLVRRSRFGLQLLAIRDDEDRALGLGVKTRRLKLSAFMISALLRRDDRWPVLRVRRPDLPEHRLRPAVRSLDRIDGVLRRAGDAGRAAARGAGARVAAAVPDAQLLQ